MKNGNYIKQDKNAYRKKYGSRCENKGFTLVELIVVLVILAILAAILVPALLGYIDKAKDYQDVLNAKNMLTATQTVFTKAYASCDDYKNEKFEKYYKEILKTADDDPYMCVIGIGKPSVYGDEQNSKYDPHKVYTVYFVGYMKDLDTQPVFYNGSEWSTDYPWAGTSKDEFEVNGQLIDMKFYFIADKYSASKQTKNGMNNWEFFKYNVVKYGNQMAKSNLTDKMKKTFASENIDYSYLK